MHRASKIEFHMWRSKLGYKKGFNNREPISQSIITGASPTASLYLLPIPIKCLLGIGKEKTPAPTALCDQGPKFYASYPKFQVKLAPPPQGCGGGECLLGGKEDREEGGEKG
jgi:hypothetical protein